MVVRTESEARRCETITQEGHARRTWHAIACYGATPLQIQYISTTELFQKVGIEDVNGVLIASVHTAGLADIGRLSITDRLRQ